MNVDESYYSMRTLNVIHASGALRKFLEARSRGASKELLTKLSAEAMEAQEAEKERSLRIGNPPIGGAVIDFERARLERESRE